MLDVADSSGVDAILADDSAYLTHVFGLRRGNHLKVHPTGTLQVTADGSTKFTPDYAKMTGEDDKAPSVRPLVIREPHQVIGIRQDTTSAAKDVPRNSSELTDTKSKAVEIKVSPLRPKADSRRPRIPRLQRKLQTPSKPPPPSSEPSHRPLSYLNQQMTHSMRSLTRQSPMPLVISQTLPTSTCEAEPILNRFHPLERPTRTFCRFGRRPMKRTLDFRTIPPPSFRPKESSQMTSLDLAPLLRGPLLPEHLLLLPLEPRGRKLMLRRLGETSHRTECPVSTMPPRDQTIPLTIR